MRCLPMRPPVRVSEYRVGFVHQAQFAGFGRVAFVLQIHEHAAAHQDAVDFGNHTGYPAHIVVFAARTGFARQELVDVLLNGGSQWRRLDILMANSLVLSGTFGFSLVSTNSFSALSVNTYTPCPNVNTSWV